MMNLTDKTVVVTGAARGIGHATVTAFAQAGAKVIATDILQDELMTLVDSLSKAGHRVTGLKHDVSNPDDWTAVMAAAAAEGGLDVMVNNAGIAILGDIETTTVDDWTKIHEVNIVGVFLGTQNAIAAMKESGGSIVNISSIAGEVAELHFAAYNASKGAVKLLTKNAAAHCAKAGYPIRINSVHPGYTETPLVAGALSSVPAEVAEALVADTISRIPMARFAQPAEIAGPILFMASDAASYITGSALVVDGGYTAV